jgi:hypothetical protein
MVGRGVANMGNVHTDVLDFKPHGAEDTMLKSLIIKLHAFQSCSRLNHETTACKSMGEDTEAEGGLFSCLATASQRFIARLDSSAANNKHERRLDFRISHVPAGSPSVYVLDCRKSIQYRLRHGWLAYEDDGKSCWFEMDGDEMMVDSGPYEYCP